MVGRVKSAGAAAGENVGRRILMAAMIYDEVP